MAARLLRWIAGRPSVRKARRRGLPLQLHLEWFDVHHAVARGDEPCFGSPYYYQVRSNITHRGKAVVTDYDTLGKSAKELLPIFRAVLAAAEQDARQDPRA
jgi:hypothetical protein